MAKIIPCIMCDKVATYTITPEGGKAKYLCTKHFNQMVKELEK